MISGMVSIIVPVYNVEKYLSKTIRSVKGQSYGNWELILVDDGSRDGSLDICKRAAEKDSRIKVHIKENGGASSARNKGIDLAEGEYILFLDSDDWLPKNALALLLNVMREQGSQLAVGSIKCVCPKNNYIILTNDKHISTADTSVMAEYIINDRPIMYMAAKLFCSKIIRENDIRFINDMKVAEDSCFVFTYLKYCDSIACVSNIVYNYNKLIGSSVSAKFYTDYMNWTLEKYKLQVELASDGIDCADVRTLYARELKRIFVSIIVDFIRNVADGDKQVAKITEVMEKIHAEVPKSILHSGLDGDVFFACLANRDTDGMLDYLKEQQNVSPKAKAVGTKQKLLSIWGKIKAWFIFKA